jgi:enterobacterial common antigen flippase
LITQEINVQAVGIYSAAFALSGMFVNFVLNAMGADYYPRLTAAADDHLKVNRLVNEQTEIGLLLALPGLLATMVLAPWIVQIFYTKEFLPAVELIQWFILGCLGRVISWPLGYVMLALNKSSTYLATALIAECIHILLIVVLLSVFKLKGVAIAFALLLIFTTTLLFYVAKSITGFSWNQKLKQLISVAIFVSSLFFVLMNVSVFHFQNLLACSLLILVAYICLKALADRLNFHISAFLAPWKVRR